MLDRARKVVENFDDYSSITRRLSAKLVAILLNLEEINASLFLDTGIDWIGKFIDDDLAFMLIDYSSAELTSDLFEGVLSHGQQYGESVISAISLFLALKYGQNREHRVDWDSQTTMFAQHISTFICAYDIAYVRVYLLMIREGVQRAYQELSILSVCSGFYAFDGSESAMLLIKAIMKEVGTDIYKESPEHQALSEKAEIGTKLEAIDSKLDSMADVLDLILSRVDGVEDIGARLEEIVSNALHAEIEKLDIDIRNSGDAHNLEECEQAIESQVGEYWLKADSFTKKAIVTAAYYLNTMPEGSAFDARGICICATVSLEQELSIIFHKHWYEYLRENYPSNEQLRFWPDRWCIFGTADGKRSKIDFHAYEDTDFSLGSMPYLFGWSDRHKDYRPARNKYRGNTIPIESFLLKELDVDEPFDWFTSEGGLLDEIDAIRLNYRNPTAHTDPISRETAEASMRDILGLQAGDTNVNTDALLWRILDIKK